MGPIPEQGTPPSEPRGGSEEVTEVIRGPALLPDPAQASRVPLPRMLLRLRRFAEEAKEVVQLEWEALEADRRCLSDWHARLEERTKAEASRAVSERSQLQADLETYKQNLLKIYNREVTVAGREWALRHGRKPSPRRRLASPVCSPSSRPGARILRHPQSACAAGTKSWRGQPRGWRPPRRRLGRGAAP